MNINNKQSIKQHGGQCRACFCAALALLLLTALPTGSAFADDPFDPYRIILTRKPFGDDPPPPPPPPPPRTTTTVRPEESFARQLRLTFMVRSDSGRMRVGIINESSNKNYFMEIGDIEDGIALIEVDYEQERALLRHEDQEAWLSLHGLAPQTGQAGSLSSGDAPAAARQTSSRYRRPPAGSTRPGITREEYQRTRAERPPPRPAREALAQAAAPGAPGDNDQDEELDDPDPEERDQKLREYNMELIRTGGEQGPPLPIQLTEEEDLQLVEEGVLPPLD